MMQPTRDEAESCVRRVVLGDLPPDAPSVAAALAAFPDLALELRQLTTVRDQLDALTSDMSDVAAEAHGFRSSRARWFRWPLGLAALLIAALGIWLWQQPRSIGPVDGRLERADGTRIDRSGPTWSVDPGMPLPPGEEYLVTLEIDGVAALGPKPFVRPIRLPAEWQLRVDRAARAHLLIELPDLGARTRVRLR